MVCRLQVPALSQASLPYSLDCDAIYIGFLCSKDTRTGTKPNQLMVQIFSAGRENDSASELV